MCLPVGLVLTGRFFCASRILDDVFAQTKQKTKIFKNLSKISHLMAIFVGFLKIFVCLFRNYRRALFSMK